MLINNNLGCIYAETKKPNLAATYFYRALDDYANSINKAQQHQGGVLLHHCGYQTHNRQAIQYNLGIALLFAGRPYEAFELLLGAVNYHHNNPRLWLRLAECCVEFYKSTRKDVLGQ